MSDPNENRDYETACREGNVNSNDIYNARKMETLLGTSQLPYESDADYQIRMDKTR